MKKDYTIDDCVKDIITARDIGELLRCMISQEEGRKTLVLTSNGLSGLETVLKTAEEKLGRVIEYSEKVSTEELKD